MKRFPEIKISIPFILLTALLYVMDFGSVFKENFAAVLIHEAAHIIAIKLCGGTINSVELCLFGIRVNVPELKYMPYKKEIIIAAAGPIAGIITAILSLAAACVFNISGLEYFIGINIVISAINLIPVYPLDGGRICFSVMLSLFSLKAASAFYYILAGVSIISLVTLSIFSATVGMFNPSLLAFLTYIIMCSVKFRPTR